MVGGVQWMLLVVNLLVTLVAAALGPSGTFGAGWQLPDISTCGSYPLKADLRWGCCLFCVASNPTRHPSPLLPIPVLQMLWSRVLDNMTWRVRRRHTSKWLLVVLLYHRPAAAYLGSLLRQIHAKRVLVQGTACRGPLLYCFWFVSTPAERGLGELCTFSATST